MKYKLSDLDSSCFQWRSLIFKTKLPPYAKLIAVHLSTFMNEHHDTAWPSLSRIVLETSISKSSVCTYLELLESEGWLYRERGGKGKSTVYSACVPAIVCNKLHKFNDNVTPLGSPTAGQSLDRLSCDRTEVVLPQDLSSPTAGHEYISNKPSNSNNDRSVKLPKNNGEISFANGDQLLFDEFWSKYPRKTAKPNAVKAFKKLKDKSSLINLISKDIARRLAANEWRLEDKQYIPHPATYLNGERWTDEMVFSTPEPFDDDNGPGHFI